MNNRVGVPMVGVGSFGAWGFDALPAFVGSGVKHLFRLEQLCNLHRTSALHAQLEDTLDYKGGGFVHNPLRSVLRVFAVAKRHICCQRYATLALCFLHSPDFAACVFGEKLVEHTSFGKVKRKQQKCSIHAGLRRDGSRSDTSLSDSQGAEITIA